MIEQGTPEWHQLRCGKVTASKLSDMLAKTKSGWGASRENYKALLVAQRLTGVVEESFTSKEMQWGTDMEPHACEAYAFYQGVELHPAPFVIHPTIVMSGASPDRFVGDDGLIEVKCPNTATHINTLLGTCVPVKYVMQIQWQMACTGRKWCDFVSFDPRMPEHLRLFVRRLNRDDVAITTLEKQVIEFLDEIDATVKALSALDLAA